MTTCTGLTYYLRLGTMADTSVVLHGVGDLLRVSIEKMAHGGHAIARLNGAVIFVRGAIPGEVVEVRITRREKSLYHADTVAVIEASADRIQPSCRYAADASCGGCDFQHIAYQRTLSLKSEVIAEQFARIAKMEIDVTVEEVSSPRHWRTRFGATTNSNGVAGFNSESSRNVTPISSCEVLIPEIDYPTIADLDCGPSQRIDVALSTDGERSVAISAARESRTDRRATPKVIEGSQHLFYEVGKYKYRVSHGSFWQSNINAPEVLVKNVIESIAPKKGEHILDLYGGVGLFTLPLAAAVGIGGRVELIEASTSACDDARANSSEYPQVKVHCADVAKAIKGLKKADVILLDPPRSGAGRDVIASSIKLAPRAIVYVACDPAALARDTTYLRDGGYHLVDIKAFDLFPQTHHIECIAVYTADKVS